MVEENPFELALRLIIMHNRPMVRLAVIFLLIFFAAFFSNNAMAEEKSLNKEFKFRKTQMQNRLKDFYKHRKTAEDFEKNRQSGAEAEIKRRIEYDKQHDSARNKFAQSRPARVDDHNLEILIKTTDPVKEAQRLETQKKYVNKRDELRVYEAQLPKVPEGEELGIVSP